MGARWCGKFVPRRGENRDVKDGNHHVPRVFSNFLFETKVTKANTIKNLLEKSAANEKTKIRERREGTKNEQTKTNKQTKMGKGGTVTDKNKKAAVTGGDLRDCLSDGEIDNCIKNIKIWNTLPAKIFYDFSLGTIEVQKLKKMILEKNKKGAVLFTVFVRHHWVACIFISEREILLFDSAPSFIVRRDIERMFADLGFTNLFFLPCPKQRRYSNECGLFVIVNLLAYRKNAKKWFGLREANLSSLRSSLDFENFLECIENETQKTKNKKESDPQLHKIETKNKKESDPQHHQIKTKDQKTTTKEKDCNEETKILCGGGNKEKEPVLELSGGGSEIFTWNENAANRAAQENLCWGFCAVVFCTFVGKLVGKSISFSVEMIDVRSMREIFFGTGNTRQQDCCEGVIEGWPLFFISPQDEIVSPPPLFIVVTQAMYQKDRILFLLESYKFLGGVNFEGNISSVGALSGHYYPVKNFCEKTVVCFLKKRDQPIPLTLPPLSTPLFLKMKEVKKFSRALKKGAWVECEWGHGEESGRWIGEVLRGHVPVLPPLVAFRFSWCGSCLAWAALDDVVLDIPFSGTIYFSLCLATGPPIVSCTCGDDDEVVDGVADGIVDTLLSAPQTAVPVTLLTPTTRLCTDEDEIRVDFPLVAPVPLGAPAKKIIDHADELEGILVAEPTHGLRGDVGARWFVFRDRPPHVHFLAWKRMASATRASHVRWLLSIKGMPTLLRRASLGSALVELCLRRAKERGWQWSTVAKSLGEVASALQQLPIYTNQLSGIDIRKDVAFAEALRRAQQLSKVTAVHSLTKPMTYNDFVRISSSCREPKTRCLLQVAWFFAARIGDLRQITREDIRIDDAAWAQNNVPTCLTFRYGKGACFWGPYSIHASLPKMVAKALVTLASVQQKIFSLQDQGQLALLLKANNLCCRSVRRGSLLHLASLGTQDVALQLLSGHKKKETLMRYLGWGAHSATAKQAALDRGELLGGAVDEELSHPTEEVFGKLRQQFEHAKNQKLQMSKYSGFCGRKGMRIATPPRLFPHKAPTTKELGIDVSTSGLDGGENWPLHCNSIPFVVMACYFFFSFGQRVEKRKGENFSFGKDVGLRERHLAGWSSCSQVC